MSLTCKQILDAVKNESGLPSEDQYFGGTDFSLTSILNRSVKMLGQRDYSIMRTAGTLTMTTATEYDLPTDLRYIIPDTFNAQDDERYVVFPTDDSTWWYFKSRSTQSGLRYKMRVAGGKLQVESPQSGMVLIYEYLSKNLVLSTGSSTADKERFTADDDTFLLDDDLLIMDVKWRYKRELGIEGWQTDAQDFARYEKTHRSKESGSGTLHFGETDHTEIAEPYTNLYV
jgi:hypothetical protein